MGRGRGEEKEPIVNVHNTETNTNQHAWPLDTTQQEDTTKIMFLILTKVIVIITTMH